ncbi:MAG: hypothetical protein U9M89_00590 [Patescibacteria group bacterium]|nr:hypothetical protein [Patescibacteria group bacterium]
MKNSAKKRRKSLIRDDKMKIKKKKVRNQKAIKDRKWGYQKYIEEEQFKFDDDPYQEKEE